VPDFDTVLPFIIEVIASARKIPSCSPSEWKQTIFAGWSNELDRLASMFDMALLNPTPLNLFNAVYNFVIAPGVILGTRFKAPSKSYDSDCIEAAINKLKRGQEKKAMKLLSSNGVAKVTPASVTALKNLHPKRQSELRLPVTECQQVIVDPAFVAKKLFSEAADQNVSKDVFGWAPWLFFACRGESKGFFASLVTFACFLANNPSLFPQVCAKLLSGGALTPLHKLKPHEQKERQDAGLPPKLRPINSGSLLSKVVLSSVLASPAGERAAEKVAPFQLSLGTSRGVEKLIHVCRAAFESRYLVGKNDYENGFNSLSRQKMLDAHSFFFPESTQVFNFFYGIDSPVYLLDEDLDVIVFNSEEGPRQGCSIGTEGFCLTIHPVICELQNRYPDFFFRVLTDDVVPIVPPPALDTYECWQAQYKRYAHCLRDLKMLSMDRAGLTLNLEKGALLLPIGAPAPSPEVRALFPTKFEFPQEGMRIAGSPIGTDAYMQEFVRGKVAEADTKLTVIAQVGKKIPREAHRLLTSCATKLLSFMASTVPPHITIPELITYDQHVEHTFFSIISPTGTECSQARLDRARLKASLPTPFGCGLFKSADQAGTAWWSSVSCSLSDALLFRLRSGLVRFAESAYNALVRLLGGVNSKSWLLVKHLYPDSHLGLLDGTFYSPSVPPLSARPNKIALKMVTKQKIELFDSVTSVSQISPTLTIADVVIASSHSFSGRIFSESLSPKRNRQKSKVSFTPGTYIAFCRLFLGLPPETTVGNARQDSSFDYPVQKCLEDHGVRVCPFLDAAGNHASSKCPSASRGVHLRHTMVRNVLVAHAKEAGLEAAPEPDTYDLLLGQFERKDCKRVFPKRISPAYKAGFEALSQASDFISSAACTFSHEQKQTFIQNYLDKLPLVEDPVGLRIDASFRNPDTDEVMWIDASVVHTCAPSYVASELKSIAKRKLCASAAQLNMLPHAPQSEVSPAMLQREIDKVKKYARLVSVAKKQKADGTRTSIPTFAPFVVSSLGDLAPKAYEVQEWIVAQYKRKCHSEGRRSDGCTVAERVREFRHSLKIGIQVAVAVGTATMVQSAGRAWRGLGPA
jgi:hypothetical protein